MNVEEEFVSISALLCEPTRARMLWNLLDGRAYTAGELFIVANTSSTSTSNHLAKLLEASILKVEVQGRHRYYSLSSPEVAYVIEGLANLQRKSNDGIAREIPEQKGVKYCRTCYDHIAGFIGVKITETLETSGYLSKSSNTYAVSEQGWKWFRTLGIYEIDFTNKRRPLTRQCLDWSERRPHLAGQLGAALLKTALHRNWFRKTKFSRELQLTAKGRLELNNLLGLSL